MASKQTYVSLLRGINVGAHKRIKMEQLRKSFDSLGFECVQTYIQSGNIVFQTGTIDPAALSKKIEKVLLSDFGFPIPVISRTADELAAAIGKNPFLKQRDLDPEAFHVIFLSEALAPAAVSKLAELILPPEQFHFMGTEIYFYLPRGFAESILMKKPLDRILSVANTTRNWRTVNQLSQMCQDCR